MSKLICCTWQPVNESFRDSNFMMTGVIRVRSDVELTFLFQIRLTYIP